MLRSLILLTALACAAHAQIWPDTWHGSTRSKVVIPPIDDRMLWVEVAGEAAETATYSGPVGRFTATAWRLKDSTAALAWYQANRPANCTPGRNSFSLCTTPGTQIQARLNYVLRFDGWRPVEAEFKELETKLPRFRSGGGMPNLPSYLPEKGRVRNSERYVLGVHSLQTVLPSFPPTIAGFEDGAEAQYGKIRSGASTLDYIVFSFHTPQLARVKTKDFEKQSGWLLRRSGPLVAVIPGGADPKAAEAILGALEWKAQVVGNQPTKLPQMPDVAGMLIAIFELTGLLLVACLVGGFLFAGFWVFLRHRRIRLAGVDDYMTVVQLQDYPKAPSGS
jgi:hypothetical protein